MPGCRSKVSFFQKSTFRVPHSAIYPLLRRAGFGYYHSLLFRIFLHSSCVTWCTMPLPVTLGLRASRQARFAPPSAHFGAGSDGGSLRGLHFCRFPCCLLSSFPPPLPPSPLKKIRVRSPPPIFAWLKFSGAGYEPEILTPRGERGRDGENSLKMKVFLGQILELAFATFQGPTTPRALPKHDRRRPSPGRDQEKTSIPKKKIKLHTANIRSANDVPI